MTMRPSRSQAKLSIVLPLLNEAGVLPRLLGEIKLRLEELGCRWNIVLVNDGSTDDSGELLDAMAYADRRLKIIHLSRNFGHQAAVHAGLTFADGDAVVLMDSDGQDDPAAIGMMLDRWLSGDDVVYAVRFGRKEGFFKRCLFKAFYGILERVASVDIPRDAGNFCLMDRRVVEQLLALDERDRYLPGLRSWVGFRQSSVRVERFARHDKHTRVSFSGLVGLAKNALFGFSRVPLLAFYYVAFLSGCVSVGCLTAASLSSLGYLAVSAGWFAQAGVIAFFGALNALGFAVVGEYIARIYDQVRHRPTFIVDRAENLQTQPQRPIPPVQEAEDRSILDELNELRMLMDESSPLPSRVALVEAKAPVVPSR